MYTLEELKELLKERVDPDLLVDELGLTTEELVERFEDKIEIKFTRLQRLIS